MWGPRIGAAIGSIGGLIFILVNAGALGDPVSLVVRVLGVVAFLGAFWFGVFKVPVDPAVLALAARPGRRAMRTYWICVVAEVVSIPIGANVITRVFHRPELVVLWVVAVVGAHFLPFAKAFHAPVFMPLSWALIAIAVAGAVLAGTTGKVAAPWAAVLAGVALLSFAVWGTRNPGTQHPGASMPRAVGEG